MIFYNSNFESNNHILYLYDYENRYQNCSESIRNSEQNMPSGRINGLNSLDNTISNSSIALFFEELDPIIQPNARICCVPSHEPQKLDTGINRLVQELSSHNRINISNSLVRTQYIEKIATGGQRTRDIHENSINIVKPEQISGQEVLLLDDIALTCNSIRVCTQKLLEAGAQKVIKLVLGYAGNKTIGNPSKTLIHKIKMPPINKTNPGAVMYKNYLSKKNQFFKEADQFYSAFNIVFKRALTKNDQLINSHDIAQDLCNELGNNLSTVITSLTGNSSAIKMAPSFIGVFLSHQMPRFGYEQLNKLDDHFIFYTPILHFINS